MSRKRRSPTPPPPPPRGKRDGSGLSGRAWGGWGFVALVVLAYAGWLWWPRSTHPGRATGGGNGSPAAGSAASAASAGPILEPQETAYAGYAGSESCRECHEKEQVAWAASNHGLAERAPREDLDRAAFDPPRSFRHGSQATDVAWNDGSPTIAAPGLNGTGDPLAVDRVIGHHPLRQYLVEFPGGRFQTAEASWDPRTNEWFNVYGTEDRRPGEWGHWTGRGMNWNAMCGTCHNTRYRKNYDEATDTFHTAMTEQAVGCESCHGPLREHVRWQRAWQGTGKKEPATYRRTPAEHMETCAPCHARRSELTGDLLPGASFWDHYFLAIVDDSPVFYPDGQVRDEDYEFAPFLGSRMHAAGVTCLDCHDPHAARPKLEGNDLCLRCHNGSRAGSPVIDPVAHSFHQPDSEGNLCVNCHMPQTYYMQRHRRHDHGFTVPDPLLTRQFGIPNACNRCHQDKDVEWTLAAAERWYGSRLDRPSRRRTQALARAGQGDPAARDPLVALLDTPETPYWKAVAVGFLERWLDQPPVRQAVLRQLGHEHPLVRYRAVQALAPMAEQRDPSVQEALRRRLDDPARAVRITAAWALRGSLPPGTRAATEVEHMLALNADQPTGQAQRALWSLARGRLNEALGHYAKSVDWDPGSPGLRHDYAVALSLAGRSADALRQTQEAVRLQPGVAENQYRLGLAWAEAGDLVQASAALEEALRLDPRHERAAYNLGLACQQLGDSARGLELLARAEQLSPRDPRIPYARATILAQLDRREEAVAALRQVLAIDPGNGPARGLLEALTR